MKSAKVYVGTYKKYNSGSLAGGWLSLADFSDYDAFLAACRKLHSDENDAEFLIEDTEGFPDGLDVTEWLYEDDFNDIKEAMLHDDEPAASLDINVVEYSAKAFAVVGDTKPIKAKLKALGGRFNSHLSCGAGWIFSNKVRAAVDAFLATRTDGATLPASPASNVKRFKDWLVESGVNKSYAVGAIKLHDGFWLIEKPSIENKFCFHDEGPDYEFYKSLMADEKKLAAYFKEKNLSDFDWRIAHMTEGAKYSGDRRVWWYKDKYSTERTYLCFSAQSAEDDYTLCTEEERALILDGLKYGRTLLEQRLDAYLKKYGVSKLHTWTYWADA